MAMTDLTLVSDQNLLIKPDDAYFKDLVRKLTEMDPDVRLAAADALQHSYISGEKGKRH